MIKSIEDWCIELGIKNYSIDNGVVNINGDVDISNQHLKKLPIKFGIVTGTFNCSVNGLISLKGCPKEVGADFDCGFNYLTTLKYSPIKVDGNFDCRANSLASLKGGPISVGGNFYLKYNNITSLKGGPLNIGGELSCYSNPIHNEYCKYDSYNHYRRSIKLKELLC
jgi:hypothetical protein